MTQRRRFLVVDGYTKDMRAVLQERGATQAGFLYRNMLRMYRPQAECDIAYPADADAKIEDLSGYDAMLWTGSSLTIYDDILEVIRQVELAREGFRLGKPAFGSCWALQVAVTAAGGACRLNPRGQEFGISHALQLTKAGAAHAVFANRSAPFKAFTSHFDEVATLPADTEILLSNQQTAIQAADIHHLDGQFFAVQYHPEFDFQEIAALAAMRHRRLVKDGVFETEQALSQFVDDCRALHGDGANTAARNRLDASEALVSDAQRHNEFANWLDIHFPV